MNIRHTKQVCTCGSWDYYLAPIVHARCTNCNKPVVPDAEPEFKTVELSFGEVELLNELISLEFSEVTSELTRKKLSRDYRKQLKAKQLSLQVLTEKLIIED